MQCPKCGSNQIYDDGYDFYGDGLVAPLIHCKECGHSWLDTSQGDELEVWQGWEQYGFAD